MKKIVLLMAFFVPLVACAAMPNASGAKSAVQVGGCHFSVPVTSKGHFGEVQGDTVNLAFSYEYEGRIYQSGIDLHCSKKNLEQVLSGEFQKGAHGWTINIGSEGGSKTSEIDQKYWHGLRTEYYLESPCVYFIGTAGKLNSFNFTICDSEETLPPQLKILDAIFSEINTN